MLGCSQDNRDVSAQVSADRAAPVSIQPVYRADESAFLVGYRAAEKRLNSLHDSNVMGDDDFKLYSDLLGGLKTDREMTPDARDYFLRQTTELLDMYELAQDDSALEALEVFSDNLETLTTAVQQIGGLGTRITNAATSRPTSQPVKRK